jgi:hypothetical protein
METVRTLIVMVIPITVLVLLIFYIHSVIESQNWLDLAQKDYGITESNVLTTGPMTHQECLDRLITNLLECENAIRYSKEEMK